MLLRSFPTSLRLVAVGVTGALTVAAAVLGATEIALTLQGAPKARLAAAILFASAGAFCWLLICAARGSWRPIGSLSRRRSTVRLLLILGLLLSLYLLAALPLRHLSVLERRSATVLSAISLLCSLATLLLIRAPRLAQVALWLNGTCGLSIITYSFWTLGDLPANQSGDAVSVTISILLALGLGVTLVVALATSWTLRREAEPTRVA